MEEDKVESAWVLSLALKALLKATSQQRNTFRQPSITFLNSGASLGNTADVSSQTPIVEIPPETLNEGNFCSHN
jgi:hypothetical protein